MADLPSALSLNLPRARRNVDLSSWNPPNLLETTLSEPPFLMHDWPVPRGHQRVAALYEVHQQSAITPALFTIPFFNHSWPVPRAARRARDLLSWVREKINIPGADSAPNRLPPPNVTLMSGPPNVTSGEKPPNVGGRS